MKSRSNFLFLEMAPQNMTLHTFWNPFTTNNINPVVLLVVDLLQQKKFLFGIDDVITSVPSKELLAFLDSSSFLSLGQALNFLFFLWLQFEIIFNNGYEVKDASSSLTILRTDPVAYLS
jgi:hypothetical protein